ncbi:PAS domain S-box protein [Microcoleus sp. K1-B6]|uniref:PAS domain S-box protein n=1 Tax=unclassified Microcoleus TaxID=2642155 RepID=UPI002FCF67D1
MSPSQGDRKSRYCSEKKMLELWKNLFAIAPFIPHGHCYLWKPGLVSLHIASDSLIALAYYSIPITLLYFVRKRQDLPYPWIFLLFSTFIIACGATHLMEIWTLWHPIYWLSGCLKAITAFISVLTAIELVPIVPKVLALPSPAQMEAANRKLEREIGERKIAEAALQEREQFLSNIYNSVTDTLWVVEQVEDGEFQVVSMNRAIESSTETLAEHWIGKRLDELWDIDTATTIRSHYHDCLQQGKTISYEENLPFGEQICCFLTTLTPLVAPDERTRLLGVSMDITERKQAENALKESEERWQLALRGNKDGIWDWNVRTNQVFFSARWKKILGYEDCEISHHLDEWAKRVHPDDFAWVMETIQNHFAKKTPFYQTEHRILCKDGTYKWILDRGQALWDDNGNAIRMVGSSTDITESKKAEAELRWKETLLRSMTDASPLAFFVVDNRSDDILYFNHRFCNIWGIEHLEEQMQRGQLKNNEIVPHCLPVLADVPAFAESCKPLQREENRAVVEDEIPFSDGRTIRRFSTQIRDESDRYFGRLYLFEDITERKQIEEQLQLADFSLERSSLALAWIDRDARILRVNQTACEQRGYSREELVSMRVWETDPNFPREVWPQHWQQLKEQKTLSFTSQQSRKDGSVLPVEITLNYLEFNGKEYNFACARDISDRYRAEEALRASQARLSGVLDIADEAIISVDSSQRITLYNQGAERIFGYTSEEMLGQTLDRLLPERFVASHRQHVDRFAQSAQTARKMGRRGEIVGRRKDGTEFPAEASISQLELTGEKVFTVFLRDISDRKQAETALKESEARFQAFMNHSPAAAWITDRDGRLLYFSKTYSRMFNLPTKYSVGKTDLNIYPAEFRQEYLKNIRKVVETNQTLEAIELAPLADGSIGEFLVYKFPLPTSSGQVLVGGVAIDVTERKKAEAALRQREQEFRALVENAPDIIMRFDRECRYLYINPIVEGQLGIPPVAFIGKTINELGAPEALVNLWRTTLEQVFETGCEQNIEYEIPSLAGLTYYASRVVPELGSDGSVQSVLAVARDISERKLAEMALKQARNELETRVKQRTALLATANKELRQEIADRKQAQVALQVSEARLKELLDNTAAFISSARIHPDRVWEYDYYSPNGEEIFGYKGEEFAADPSLWLSRIPAEDIEAIVLPAMEDLYNGQQLTIEYRFCHKNGNFLWLSNTLLAKKHASEDYWFATGIVIDITERKQAEKALQESEQRFATLAKTAPVGIFRTDIQGNCVYGNERSFEMIGLSPEESIGAGWATAIHPEDRDRTIAAWLSFVQQGIPYHCEHRFKRLDGSVIWVLGQAIAEKDVDGNTIGYIGTITDITERKQSEQLLKDYNQLLETQVQERTAALTQTNAQLEQEIEERKQIEDQLRRSETKLSAILDNAGACIYIKDLNGTYLYVNRLTEEFFGCSASEIIGNNDRNFFAEEFVLAYKETCDRVTNSGLVHRFEEIGIDSNGELHYVLSTKVPLKNSDGDVYGLCGISTDITELKKTEAALRQSEERMQALLSAIPDLMLRHRVDGTYLDVAGNDSSLLVPRDEFIGKKLQETPIPEQIKTDLLERFQVVAETGTLQLYEHDLEKPDGIHSYETRIVKSGVDEVVCLVRDITERKRAQVALQESEERYRTVITAMAEGIVLQDADGAIRTCNASAKRILGLSRKQMMGRTSLDPNWRAVREDGSPFPGEEHPAMVTLRTGKACLNVVMGVHKPDGSFTWISINSQPLRRAGEPLPHAVVCSFADITARKQAQEALRQSEARYLAILEDQTEMIGRSLPDGTLTFVNEAFCRFYGMTREQLIGHCYEPNVFEEDRELVARLVKTLSVDNPLVIIENRVIAKGQEVRWTQWVNRGIFDENGQLLEFQGVGRDITDRKLAEESLRRYEKIVAATTDAICLVDRNYTYQVVNQAYLNWHHRNREEILGRTISEVLGKELFEAQIKPRVERCLSGETVQYELWVKYPNAEEKFLSATYAPYVEADGTISGVVASLRNLTKLKQMEVALQQSESTLRAFFNSSVMMMGIVELYEDDFLHLSANPATAQFFGTTPEAMQNHFVGKSGMPRSLLQLWLGHYWEAVKTQAPVRFEYAHETPTGQKWLSASVCPITIGSNGRPRLSYIVEDVSDRKRAEEALQQSESTLRSFFDSGSMLMGIVELYDDDILHLSDNPTSARFFGTTPEQMKNRFASEMGVPPAHLQQWIERYREALQTQAAVRFEYPHETPTELKWLSASVCPIGIGSNGRPRLSYIVEDISERKRAEEALSLSEGRLKHLTASIPGTLYSFGYYPDGSAKFEYVSPGCRDLFELEPEQVLAERNLLENQVSPDDRPRFEEAISYSLQNLQPVTAEWRNINPSGKQRWLRAQAQPECREDGSKVWHGVILDITERKLAEEKLKRAEYKYRTLIEQIPGIVYISPLEATTEEAYISPQLQQLLEVPPEEWSAGFFNSWADYVHPEDRDRVWQAVSTTISTGEPLRVEYRMITRNGRTVWIRDRANLVLSSDGRTRVLQGLALDISDRKQIEQALQESNERFHLATSAVKGFIYDWDLKPNIVLRTRGLFELVGYRPEEADAKVDWWNEHVHPEDLPKISQQLSEAFANETQSYYVLEYRLRHRDGHYVYLSDYGTISRDANRRPIRAVGHSIDVSERKQAEAALQKALQAAQAASVAKSRFLSNMSHELRTPLNAILGFSQVMVRSSSVSPDQKEQLKIINRSGEHLLNLINDILSMAKIEAGQTTLNENRFDLYQLLNDLEQMLKLKALSKGLQLTFERALNVPQYVQTDENKLRQILINLLGNAIKFTASGHVVSRVKKSRLSGKSDLQDPSSKTYLLFEIEDTGPGIAPAEIKTLFDPFVQTEAGRKSMQGTGLGLPISRQFVEMMGGEIAVSSQLGQGTIFAFDILASAVAEPDDKSLLITQEVIGLEPNQPVYRILVVEDVEENRQLLLKILKPLGFEVREAVNGQEAIALWSTWKPHLIWMDMRMPVMDGYEATREIKALEQQSVVARENNNLPTNSSSTNATKIIALTASAFDEDRAKIMTAGCDDFIHKPFRESILFDKMAQHLGVRYIYQEDWSNSSPELATPRNLTPEDLNVMPSEWIAQFRQEVLCANDELILQLIDQIPESEASLAHTLADLVNNFRLDILFNLVRASSNE